MHTGLLIIICLTAYATGAMLVRMMLGVRRDVNVHPLETLQIAGLVPMVLLADSSKHSLVYHFVYATAVCLMGAIMAAAILLAGTSLRTQPTDAPGLQDYQRTAGIADFLPAVLGYEICMLRSIQSLMGYFAGSLSTVPQGRHANR